MKKEKPRDDDQAAREAAARTLQKQIDDLLKGDSEPGEQPTSLRDFIESQRKLRKANRRKTRKGARQSDSPEDETPDSSRDETP